MGAHTHETLVEHQVLKRYFILSRDPYVLTAVSTFIRAQTSTTSDTSRFSRTDDIRKCVEISSIDVGSTSAQRSQFLVINRLWKFELSGEYVCFRSRSTWLAAFALRVETNSHEARAHTRYSSAGLGGSSLGR